ncbi:8628_t:CDS:1, partial [Cetraspora pellucida]
MNQKNSKLLELRKLKDKLLNLSPLHNRKIRFTISEKLAWDLSELLNKNDSKLVTKFSTSVLNLLINHCEGQEKLSLELENFFRPFSWENITKLQKKVYHLQKKNQAVYQEKGYKALFLGVIFVRGYFYNNKNVLRLVNAPLFLLPCDLEKIKNLSLVFQSERKVNYSLLYYLQKELGLAKEKLTDFLNKLENSKGMEKWENYLSFLVQEFQNWLATSRVKIELSSVISSLEEKEKTDLLPEDKKENTSPFAEPELAINNRGSIGRIVAKESKKVQRV